MHCFVPSRGGWEYIYIESAPPAARSDLPQPASASSVPAQIKGESGHNPADTGAGKAAGIHQPLSDRPPAP
jgi:hypothetical protein